MPFHQVHMRRKAKQPPITRWQVPWTCRDSREADRSMHSLLEGHRPMGIMYTAFTCGPPGFRSLLRWPVQNTMRGSPMHRTALEQVR